MEILHETQTRIQTCKNVSLSVPCDLRCGSTHCAAACQLVSSTQQTADTAADPRQPCQLEHQINSNCCSMRTLCAQQSIGVHSQRRSQLARGVNKKNALSCRSVSAVTSQSVPAAGARVGQVDKEFTHLLGSRKHHKAFLRAWHSRIHDSISTLEARTSARQNTRSHQGHFKLYPAHTQLLGSSLQSSLCSDPLISRFSQRDSLSQPLHPAVHPLRSSPRVSCADSTSNAAMTPALPAAGHHAAVRLLNVFHERSAEGTADAEFRRRSLAQAAQHWLQQLHPVQLHEHQGVRCPTTAPIMSHPPGVLMQDIIWQPASGAEAATENAQQHTFSASATQQSAAAISSYQRPAVGLVDTPSVLHQVLPANDYWLYPAARHLSNICASQSSQEHLAAVADDFIHKCTVQCSRKTAELCSICLDNMAVNELAPLLMCGHRVHCMCLKRWVVHRLPTQLSASRQPVVVCPVCKQNSVDRQSLAVV